MVSASERVSLLLSIKEAGKGAEFGHIYEKVSRDVLFLERRKVREDEVEAALSSLINRGLVEKREQEFVAREALNSEVAKLVETHGKELNRSYVMVWQAKNYYPFVGELMMPFLKGRAVSAVKIFSGKKNPIEELDAIFVRYSRYKPKPVFLTIDAKERLNSLVFDHCVDFIPYVHKLDSNEPDVFVLDLDAGEELLKRERSFEFLKFVTKELVDLLDEVDIQTMVKFSGSRGFQIWASLDNSKLDGGDLFRVYRELAMEAQRRLEKRLQAMKKHIKSEFPECSELGASYTTSVVAKKEERVSQVLVDWSVLKPMGDVRAPFSMHYKTGLVSLPLSISRLMKFELQEAEPLKTRGNISNYADAAKIVQSSPEKLVSKAS